MLLAAFAALGVAFLFGRRLVAAIKLASDAAILLGEGGKPPVMRSSIVELQDLVKLVTLSAAEPLSEIEFDLRALGLAHLNRSVVHLVFSHHLGEAPK